MDAPLYCDLHMHSTASDGTTPPERLGELAREAGVAAIALTDHDTTAGVKACAKGCREAGVEFVPGIEVSADPALDGDRAERFGTLHILGLFIKPDDPGLQEIHQRMTAARDHRNPRIVEKLNALGVNINYSEVLTLAGEQGTAVIGRPHIAQVLVKKGYAKSIKDAFTKYIGQGAPAYSRRDQLSAKDAIHALHSAGGLAILAHPIQLRRRDPEMLEHMIKRLVELDLDGIETRHSDHTAAEAEHFEQLADRFDLLAAGGSDFHGERKSFKLGSQHVPFEVFEKLQDEATRRRGVGKVAH